MSPVFIFTETIADQIRAGRKKIEVPEGARISSAAMDLIRDNKAEIVYVSPDSEPPKGLPSDRAGVQDTGPSQAEAVRGEPSEGTVIKETVKESLGEVSDTDVEKIVNRVIARFRELKGEVAPSSAPDREAAEEEGADLVICRCEEITRGEIKAAIRNGMKTLNGVKRITRAGMGLCQGQTCQRLVIQILARELGIPAGSVEPTTARAPVRPIPISAFATG